ncbi:MAG: hypothetical protein ACW981_09690 [Candidatus Hodarchaeales archaeon]|jgi:hypothetical protein
MTIIKKLKADYMKFILKIIIPLVLLTILTLPNIFVDNQSGLHLNNNNKEDKILNVQKDQSKFSSTEIKSISWNTTQAEYSDSFTYGSTSWEFGPTPSFATS